MSDKTEKNTKIPDHTLANASIEGKDDPPQVYAVSDLRAYVKPAPAEELGGFNQKPGYEVPALADCGTEVVCRCVAVEGCAFRSVEYHVGGCPSTCTCAGEPCACQCTCTCMPYYYPY